MHNFKFPIMFFSLLKLSYNAKRIMFYIRFSKNTWKFLSFFKNNGFIISYFRYKNKIKIFLNYSNLVCLFPKIKKLYFIPSNKINISVIQLHLISRSIGSSLIVLSTDKGILSHLQCIKQNIGGVICFILYN